MGDSPMQKLGKEEAKRLIVKVVANVQGCKATELAANTAIALGVGQDLPKYLEELVRDDELIELEYTVPSIPYRLKSFLLPKGSTGCIKIESLK